MAEGATIVGSKAALPSFKEGKGAGVRVLDVTSNDSGGKTISLVNGLISFSYYESILQDVIRATVVFTDTGDSVDGKSVMEGLPIYGTEKANIKIEDNNSNVIGVELYVNKPAQLLDDTRKKVTLLNFASKEFFDNEKVRINIRFDGLISKSVDTILAKPKQSKGQGGRSLGSTTTRGGKTPSQRKGFLKTEKELFIEKTSNKRNFVGNNWKSFYTINWLAKQAVPSTKENPKAPKNSAGFMFWETAEGFHFKSIDGLMNTEKNKVKRKFIYNETSEGPCSGQMPEGYDAKVLEMSVDNRVNVQEKLKMGAYSTRTWTFNPYNTDISIEYPNAGNGEAFIDPPSNIMGRQEDLELAADKFPVFNKEFNQNIDFSFSKFMVLDTGTLPDGPGSGENSEQIKKSKDENSKPSETVGQGTMRMNQLFASKVIITIPGDFELRAGDAVYFDAPGHKSDKKKVGNDEIDKHISGNYIISSICHYLDGGHTLSKMDLIRDSYGRKPMDRKQSSSKGFTENFQGVEVPRSRGSNFL